MPFIINFFQNQKLNHENVLILNLYVILSPICFIAIMSYSADSCMAHKENNAIIQRMKRGLSLRDSQKGPTKNTILSALHFIHSKGDTSFLNVSAKGAFKNSNNIIQDAQASNDADKRILKRYKRRCLITFADPTQEQKIRIVCKKLRNKIRKMFLTKLTTFAKLYMTNYSKTPSKNLMEDVISRAKDILSSDHAFKKADPIIHSISLNITQCDNSTAETQMPILKNIFTTTDLSTVGKFSASRQQFVYKTNSFKLPKKFYRWIKSGSKALKSIKESVWENDKKLQIIINNLVSKDVVASDVVIPSTPSILKLLDKPSEETTTKVRSESDIESLMKRLGKVLRKEIGKRVDGQNERIRLLTKNMLAMTRNERRNNGMMVSLMKKFRANELKLTKSLASKIQNMEQESYYSSQLNQLESAEKKLESNLSKMKMDRKKERRRKISKYGDRYLEEDKLKLFFVDVTTATTITKVFPSTTQVFYEAITAYSNDNSTQFMKSLEEQIRDHYNKRKIAKQNAYATRVSIVTEEIPPLDEEVSSDDKVEEGPKYVDSDNYDIKIGKKRPVKLPILFKDDSLHHKGSSPSKLVVTTLKPVTDSSPNSNLEKSVDTKKIPDYRSKVVSNETKGFISFNAVDVRKSSKPPAKRRMASMGIDLSKVTDSSNSVLIVKDGEIKAEERKHVHTKKAHWDKRPRLGRKEFYGLFANAKGDKKEKVEPFFVPF